MYSDSEKLKRFRKSLDLGQVAFAQDLNIARATISMIECGKYKISHTVKEAIKQKYNYDIDTESYITKKEFVVNTSNIVPVPFYEVKAAANPKGEIMMDYPESQALYFDKRWLENILGVNPFNASIIQAKGDSMDSGLNKSTDIKDGDLLLVDNSNINLVNGLIYVIELGYNELLVKKVVQDIKGQVSLISNNTAYPPRILTEADNARTIGRVVWNGSKGNI